MRLVHYEAGKHTWGKIQKAPTVEKNDKVCFMNDNHLLITVCCIETTRSARENTHVTRDVDQLKWTRIPTANERTNNQKKKWRVEIIYTNIFQTKRRRWTVSWYREHGYHWLPWNRRQSHKMPLSTQPEADCLMHLIPHNTRQWSSWWAYGLFGKWFVSYNKKETNLFPSSLIPWYLPLRNDLPSPQTVPQKCHPNADTDPSWQVSDQTDSDSAQWGIHQQ